MEWVIDLYSLTGFIISLPFLFLIKNIYKEDTSVESSFFTIDTAKTLRFVFGYLILLEAGVLGFLMVFPYLLLGIFLLIGALIIFLINLILALLALIVVIFTLGGVISFQMQGFQIFDFIANNIFPGFLIDVIYDSKLVVAIFVFFTITPIFSGYLLGKYVESRKSATLTELSWHMVLLNITMLLAIYNPMEVNVGFYFGLFTLHWVLSRISINRAFTWKDNVREYSLPDIIKFKRVLALLFGGIGLAFLSVIYFGFLDEIFGSFDDPFLMAQKVLFVAPSVIVATFGVLFFLQGDHPLEIRIDEIDAREDLLELAKEFRELDPSKMDEYMKKGDSQIRYV